MEPSASLRRGKSAKQHCLRIHLLLVKMRAVRCLSSSQGESLQTLYSPVLANEFHFPWALLWWLTLVTPWNQADMFVHQPRCRPRRQGTQLQQSLLSPSGRRIGVCQGLRGDPSLSGEKVKRRWARIVRNIFQPPGVNGQQVSGIARFYELLGWVTGSVRKQLIHRPLWWQYIWSKAQARSPPGQAASPLQSFCASRFESCQDPGPYLPASVSIQNLGWFLKPAYTSIKWKQTERKKKGKEREREDKRKENSCYGCFSNSMHWHYLTQW